MVRIVEKLDNNDKVIYRSILMIPEGMMDIDLLLSGLKNERKFYGFVSAAFVHK